MSFSPLTTVHALLAAAHREGLALQTDATELDGSGLDFLVLHARDNAGTPWIVRTPRRDAVRASMRIEAQVLAHVRDQLPVAVPDWRVCADDVVAYPRLDGTPAITVSDAGPTWHVIDPAAPSDRFLDSFATMLVALQAIPSSDGVPRKSMSDVRAELSRAMDASRSALSPPDALWARWHRWLDNDALWPTHVAMVHGDLHPGHLLLGDDGVLVGVLDWTEAHIGDPATDLAMFHGCFGAGALASVIDRFAQRGGTTWPHLAEHCAERWAAFPALGADWALRNDNTHALEFARSMVASP